ncbi:MAG: hypothetical protein KJ065_08510, partial [Anaerolineae bacterium]|nr:hypothetical protein [Anaerolineae bacterium]
MRRSSLFVTAIGALLALILLLPVFPADAVVFNSLTVTGGSGSCDGSGGQINWALEVSGTVGETPGNMDVYGVRMEDYYGTVLDTFSGFMVGNGGSQTLNSFNYINAAPAARPFRIVAFEVGGGGGSPMTFTFDPALYLPACGSLPNLAPSASITLTESGGSTAVTEGGPNDTFTLNAATNPTAAVTIPISASVQCEVSTDGTNFFISTNVILPAGSMAPQTVTVRAVDDNVVEASQSCTITTDDPTSGDSSYNALTAGAVADVSVSITENDVAGYNFSSTPPAEMSENGGSYTILMTLTGGPLANVTINFSAGPASACTLASAASHTFDAGTFWVPFPITVNGVDDILIDGDQTCTITMTKSSSAPGYSSLGNPPSQTVTVKDDDTPGYAITGPTPASTSENGGTSTVTLALMSIPSADVNFTFSASPASACTLATAATHTFNAGNYNTPFPITVNGVNDAVADGNQTCTITLAKTSTAAGYDVLANPADQTVTVTDDEVAGYSITGPTPASMSENGGSSTVTLALTGAPTADVNFTFSANPASACTLATAATHTFNAGNYNTPFAITVNGVDDVVTDGSQTCTIALTKTTTAYGYDVLANPADQTVTVTDDEVAGYSITGPTPASMSENGGSATVTLALNSAPNADVNFTFNASPASACTLATAANYTFNAGNYSTPFAITVNGVDDVVTDGNQTCTITLTKTTTAYGYDVLANPANQTVTVTDDDVASFALTGPTPASMSENGGSATVTLALTSAPNADVNFTFSASPASACTLATAATYTFNAGNYNTPFAITVNGVDDVVTDGNQTCTITLAKTTTALGYDVLANPANQTITVTDDDVAGFSLTGPTPASMSENGGSSTVTLALTSAPDADVNFTFSAGPASACTLATAATYTFNVGNYSTPFAITVNGVDDVVTDGNQTCTITLTKTTTAYGYDVLANPANQTVTVTDDDVASFALTGPTPASMSENGGSATVTLALTSAPNADVNFTFSASPASACTLATAATYTFNAGNYNTPFAITVTGVDDVLVDGSQTCTITLGKTTTALSYDVLADPANQAVTVTDDDVAGFALSGPTPASMSENGGSATVTLALTGAPNADVNFTFSAGPASACTLATAATYTFNAGNYNTPFAITVNGVDDVLTDGSETCTITLTKTTTALGYDVLADPANQTVTVTDDDVAGFAFNGPTPASMSENGGSSTLTLALTTAPNADVNFTFSAGPAGACTLATAATYTFNAGNYNAPFAITVNGVDDALTDGSEACTITLAKTTTALGYDVLANPANQTVTVADDDVPGYNLTGPTPASMSENGGTSTVTLALTTAPSADVNFT